MERDAPPKAKRATKSLFLSGIHILFTCARSVHVHYAKMGIIPPGDLHAAFHGLQPPGSVGVELSVLCWSCVAPRGGPPLSSSVDKLFLGSSVR